MNTKNLQKTSRGTEYLLAELPEHADDLDRSFFGRSASLVRETTGAYTKTKKQDSTGRALLRPYNCQGTGIERLPLSDMPKNFTLLFYTSICKYDL